MRESSEKSRWKRYPKYKDSGVEWLGEIPEGWKTTKIKHICIIAGRIGFRGYTKDDQVNEGEGALILGASEIDNYGKIILNTPTYLSWNKYYESPEIIVKRHNILVVQRGSTCGKVGFIEDINEPTTINPSVVLIKEIQVEGKFLFHLISSSEIQDLLHSFLASTAIPMLTQEQISNTILLTPPLPEQTAIAAFLDRETARIDALIEKKQRQIELLQEKRAALISQAVTKGLDPTVPMKDSGVPWLGEVPEHWEFKRLKHISPRISGRLVYSPAQYFSEEGVPFLFGTNITNNGISLDNVKRIPPEINQRFSHHALHKDDVVMVRVGAPGLSLVIPTEAEGLNCASLMIIRKSLKFNSQWLALSLNSRVGRQQVDLVTYGAAQEQINIGDAVNFTIPTPPLPEQIEISVYCSNIVDSSINKALNKILKSIETLQEYRSALISAAVTGKIDVREETSA